MTAAAEEKTDKGDAEEKAGESTVEVMQPQPITLKAKVTLNEDVLTQFAALLLKGDKDRLEKIKNLIGFVNGLEYQLMYDGADAEGYVSLKGEDLASFLALHDKDKVTVMTDMIPNYSFTVTKEDLTDAVPQMTGNADLQKIAEAIITPVLKAMQGVKFGEAEKVEETILDTVFTAKTPIDMTAKEMALLGLNTVKEILENKSFAPMLEMVKARGIDISAGKIDQLIEAVNNTKEEDAPVVKAAVYTNEKQDVIVKVEMIQNGQETMHSIGGVVNGKGVSEYQMGDKVYSSVKVGNDGIFAVARIMGMEFEATAVPETRENGKAVIETLTMNGMELAKAETELIRGATLKGTFNTANKTELTLKDLKTKPKRELLRELRKDVAANYKPILQEKLKKVAPEVVSIFVSLKKLVKQSAPAVLNQLQPQK